MNKCAARPQTPDADGQIYDLGPDNIIRRVVGCAERLHPNYCIAAVFANYICTTGYGYND